MHLVNKVLITLFAFFHFSTATASPLENETFSLNTSNPGKQKEFKRFFEKNGLDLDFSSIDLDEIDATPLEVVVHKASQMPDHVIVEDTSLDIDGEDVGVNIKYLISHLDQYVSKKAHWRVLLAYKEQGQVYVFEGKIDGTIVPSQGEGGFGFDPFFLPNGESLTLAQAKPDNVNARDAAVQALIDGNYIYKGAPIYEWDGPWQQN
jgi:XTP/dITP diphosphohydrolase